MNARLEKAMNDNTFVKECNSFTCKVRKDMGNCSESVPDQITQRLSGLESIEHMIDIPIIGSILMWFAKQ